MNPFKKHLILCVLVLSTCVLKAQNENRLFLSVAGEAIGYLKAKDFGWGCSFSVGRNFNRFGLSVGYECFTGYAAAPYHPGIIFLPSKKWSGVALTEKYYIKQSGNWHIAVVLKEHIGWSKGETLLYYPDAEASEITEVRGKYSISDWFMSLGCEISRSFNRFGIHLTPMLTIPLSNPIQGGSQWLSVGVCYSLPQSH